MPETIKQALSLLKEKYEIFSELTEQEIGLISPLFDQKNYAAESFLFREGEPSTFICFVVTGKLEITKETDIQDHPIMLGTLSTGSFTGETALLEGSHTRAVSVSAIEDSEVLILGKNDLEHITREYPETGVKLLKELARILTIRLLKAIERISRSY
jgi:CRP-like cAMP-binding protein